MSKARNHTMGKIMMPRGEKQISSVAYPLAAGVLALALAACEEKPSGNALPVAPVAVAPQAVVQPVQPKIEPPKPADVQKAPESPQATEDAALAEKVKSALGADRALRASTVDVGVSGGVVTLFGTADTREHRDRAAQLAANVPGVKSVKNQMVIVAGS
jgi:hyperosmotically inducible periplasmic protein